MGRGRLVVISGFSGAGKGTVIRKMMQEREEYVLSVSMTTRAPRSGETHGVEYFFVSNAHFEELVRQDGLLEHAGFVDHYYGTPRAFVEEKLQEGRNVLLEIEVQGAMQIREKFPEALLIFIAPPDADALEERLKGRKTETKESVTKRLTQALQEVRMIPEYPYLVINDDADACAVSLHTVICSDPALLVDGGVPIPKGGELLTEAADRKAFVESFEAGLRKILARREQER